MKQYGFILYYFRYLQDLNCDVIKSATAIARTIRWRFEFGVNLLDAVDMEAVMRETHSLYLKGAIERYIKYYMNGLKSDLILPVIYLYIYIIYILHSPLEDYTKTHK